MKVYGQFSGRTPFIIFASLFVFLRALFPYSLFNSDVANYGYMGNDILRYGYLPTIPYGQNYLFPITPYIYALYRVIAPSSFSDVFVLTAAGGTLTLAGYWMVYESLLLVMKMEGKEPVAPGALFVAFLALSPQYYDDMTENSGLEVGLFILGVMTLTATLMEAAYRRSARAGVASAFVFGMAWAYSLYARPQIAVYGAVFFAGLAVAAWKSGKWRGASRLAVFTAAGWAVGYVPMLLHKVYRAHKWPFDLKSDLHIGTISEMQDRIGVFVYRIFHEILSLDMGGPYFFAFMTALAVASVVLFAEASIRRPKETSVAGSGLFWGSAVIILAMTVIPGLSWNSGMRRYCLHVYVAFAFLFASAFSFRQTAMKRAMAAGVVLTMILSTSAWSKKLAEQMARNSDYIDTKAMIPVLAAQKKVIIAEYWDAYLLGFMAEGKLDIEVFPWELVRRYGAIPERKMREGSVWLICEGFGSTVYKMIEKDLGKPKAKTEILLPHLGTRRLGARHVYTEFGDPAIAADLMKKTRPEYFTVKYPPGS